MTDFERSFYKYALWLIILFSLFCFFISPLLLKKDVLPMILEHVPSAEEVWEAGKNVVTEIVGILGW